eukprot:tig00000983_g5912.t1
MSSAALLADITRTLEGDGDNVTAAIFERSPPKPLNVPASVRFDDRIVERSIDDYTVPQAVLGPTAPPSVVSVVKSNVTVMQRTIAAESSRASVAAAAAGNPILNDGAASAASTPASSTPASSTYAPASTLHAPFSAVYAPASTSHAPASTSHAPASVAYKPASISYAPASGLLGTLAPASYYGAARSTLSMAPPTSSAAIQLPSFSPASPSRIVSRLYENKREQLDRLLYGTSGFKVKAELLLKQIIDLQSRLDAAMTSPAPNPSPPSSFRMM